MAETIPIVGDHICMCTHVSPTSHDNPLNYVNHSYRPSWLTLSYITVATYIRVYDKIDMIGNKASLRDAQRTG